MRAMNRDPLGVLAATRQVVEKAGHVAIDPAAIARLAERLRPRPPEPWDSRRHLSGDPELTAAYILVLDTLNFCFWGEPAGYWELAERLRDTFQDGVELWQPRRLSTVSEAELRSWIGSFPLMPERVRALHELGQLAQDQAGGRLTGLIAESAIATAARLATRLHSFADVADYHGLRVPLFKRAQIAAADLHGSGARSFSDVAHLTAFADYKLPQLLRHHGALVYSARLAARVDRLEELAPGEPAEVEIRAATIQAVEQLRAALSTSRKRAVSAVEVDWALWELSQHEPGMAPHHRTRTWFY